MGLPTIGALWIGGALSWLEQLCLKSFRDNGHEVVLFTYEGVENVPEGIRVEPASAFLPTDRIIRHAKTGSPAYHADLFRLNMLRDSDLIWADTDAYCHRPWNVTGGTHFHGWISDDKPLVNNGVLGLPKDSKTLAAMLDFTSDEFPVPPWFKASKQAELRALKEAGQGVHVSEMPWGVWGPNALTWFLQQTGEIAHSFPGHVLYPVPFKKARTVFVKKRTGYVGSLLRDDTLSIHFWGRRFRNIAANFEGRCEVGSFVDHLLIKHRVDPSPTAHMMQRDDEDQAAGDDDSGAKGQLAGIRADTDNETPPPAAQKVPAKARTFAQDAQDSYVPVSDPATVITAIDLDEVAQFCDINGAAPDLAAAFYHKFACDISVVYWGQDGTLLQPEPGAFEAYAGKLGALGVPHANIHVARTGADVKPSEVIASVNGYGMRERISPLKALFGRAAKENTRVIVDISKGSGSYPFLNKFGSCHTLVQPTADDPGRAIMSFEPRDVRADWGYVARDLAGATGFFNEFDSHSFLYVQRGKTLVVTFDNLDIAMNKRDDRRPWGFGFIEKNGWSMLGVMADGWTWFRDRDVVAEFDRLRDVGFFDQFKRVVFYGASMGGYGAAAFSAAAPGSTVFVISPQSTLDKSVVPWEDRYKAAWGRDFSGHYGDAALSSQSAAQVHLLYDPYVAADTGHADRFTGANVTKWRCPLLGHRLGSSLHQMGVLQHISRDAIDGTLQKTQFYQHLRTRHGFPRYQRELANLALKRDRADLAELVCDVVLAQRNDRFFRQMKARIGAADQVVA